MSAGGDERIAAVLELKDGLTDHATGGAFDTALYQALRTELMRASWAKGLVPACLLYGGRERLKINKILCLPCEEFLRNLVPDSPVPLG